MITFFRKRKVYNFNQAWTTEFGWMSKRHALKKVAFCTICHHVVTPRRFHLFRHQDNQAHVRKANLLRQTPTITSILKKTPDLTAAENMLVMLAVEHNIAFNAMDHIVKVVQRLCLTVPETSVKKLSCGRSKATSIVRDRFAPTQLQNVAGDLKRCRFSILLDETTDCSSSKSLAVIVRYFDRQLENKFLGLIAMPEATSKNIYDAVMNLLAKLEVPLENLVGYGADNASNMMGGKSGLKALFLQANPHIFVMGCICHSLALCSSSASEKLPDEIEQFVHDVYNHFAHSAKRKGIFERFQKLFDLKPHELLRPCQTRWLSVHVSKHLYYVT